jgi:hypothetical protein
MEKELKLSTIKAINRLRDLLTRDCGSNDWELCMSFDTIYISGGWKDDDIEVNTKLPLKPLT